MVPFERAEDLFQGPAKALDGSAATGYVIARDRRHARPPQS